MTYMYTVLSPLGCMLGESGLGRLFIRDCSHMSK